MRHNMGDLDTSLIQEFANRPAFYNKTSPHYKDKLYIEQAWIEIATKLGYDVVLLKDRIYQLRNRYNLEKRKVESLRLDGIHDAKSSWPLFGYLTFLDGHIRPRKSYKSMMRRSQHDGMGGGMGDGMHHGNYHHHHLHHNNSSSSIDFMSQSAHHHMPGKVEIKYERGDVSDVPELYACDYENNDDDARNAQSQNGDHFINPAQFLDDTESEHDPNIEASQQTQATNRHNNTLPDVRPAAGANNLLLRNINSLKRAYNADNSLPKMYGGKFKMPRHNNFGSSTANNSMHQQLAAAANSNHHHGNIGPSSHVRQAPHQSTDKFNAFGLFLTSSLLDMPENKALGLIEKFTNDIVRALIDKTSTATSGDEIANTPASANSSTTLEENNV